MSYRHFMRQSTDESMPTIVDARVLSGSGGGPDKTLINSPPFLEKAGYRMLCAYMHDPADPGFGVLQQKARQRGVELISIADHGPLDWRVVSRALAMCRRERVAVWHGHDYKTNALGLVLKRFYPMRLVTTLHGWVHQTSRTPLYYLIDRLSLRFYEKVICVSDDLVVAAQKAGVPKSRCLLLENGIDVDVWKRRQSPQQARERSGLPERFTVGAAGRLSSEKGFDILIRAVDRLLKEGLDLQLVIAGEGVEKENLQRLIGELGRTDQIRLMGYCSDLTELYEAMDVYALSSYREGLPNVLLEAMAIRTPVVATAVNGVPRLIEHGVSGELVPAGNVEAMVTGLQRMVVDANRREQYALAGRETIEQRFSFAVRMDKLARLYDELGLSRGRSCASW